MKEIQIMSPDSKLALATTTVEALRRGYYDIAIDAARKGVAESPKPWEENNDVKSAADAPNWQYYLQFLAVARELKGDWNQAQKLCAAAYGSYSHNLTWLNARIFYSTGETDVAFFYLMQVTPRFQYNAATMKTLNVKSKPAKQLNNRKETEGGCGLIMWAAKENRSVLTPTGSVFTRFEIPARELCGRDYILPFQKERGTKRLENTTRFRTNTGKIFGPSRRRNLPLCRPAAKRSCGTEAKKITARIWIFCANWASCRCKRKAEATI